VFHLPVELSSLFSESFTINQMQDSHDMAEIFLWGTNQENLHVDGGADSHFELDGLNFASRRL
jgi:hypothetical protein